jgi:hypothetical protein
MKIRDVIGESVDEAFLDYDYTRIQETLNEISNNDTPDIAHAQYLQHKCLVAADILAEYSGKIIKHLSYLENKLTSIRNKYALEYRDPITNKATGEMRAFAVKSCPDADEYEENLARAKGVKALLDKKFDILIKAHHLYKDVANQLIRTIPGENNVPNTDEKTNWR